MPKNDEGGEKIWMTNDSDILHIYEYKNKQAHQNNTILKMHKLNPPGFRVSIFEQAEFSIWDEKKKKTLDWERRYFLLQGNAHVVYNGSFYYQENRSDKIVRYDLEFSKQIGMYTHSSSIGQLKIVELKF